MFDVVLVSIYVNNVLLTLNYHIESQNYGKIWHDHDAQYDSLIFIKEEAKVR